MAALRIHDESLTLELSTWEKVGGLRRTDPSFPLASISSVERLENSRDAIRGMRAPGTGWPGRIALGYWRTRRTVDFVAVYRNEPGYLIKLSEQPLDRLVVSSSPVADLEGLAVFRSS